MRLNKTERKILVFNKMKQKGLSYEQAYKEVEKELEHLKKLTKEKRKNGKRKI